MNITAAVRHHELGNTHLKLGDFLDHATLVPRDVLARAMAKTITVTETDNRVPDHYAAAFES